MSNFHNISYYSFRVVDERFADLPPKPKGTNSSATTSTQQSTTSTQIMTSAQTPKYEPDVDEEDDTLLTDESSLQRTPYSIIVCYFLKWVICFLFLSLQATIGESGLGCLEWWTQTDSGEDAGKDEV